MESDGRVGGTSMRVIDTPFGYYLTWLYMPRKTVAGLIEDEKKNQQIYMVSSIFRVPPFFSIVFVVIRGSQPNKQSEVAP